jgi:hypothetical protein
VIEQAAPAFKPRSWITDRHRRLRDVAVSGALAQLTAGVLVLAVAGALHYRNMADFHVMRDAGREIVEGRAGSFVYPPPSAFLLIPFGFLPYEVAAGIWLALILISIPLMLLVLGVRDWRCHAVTLLAASTLSVLGSGSLSAFLALGAAFLWKYRDRRVPAVLLVAGVVIAKLYLWPLLVWLIATRRSRTAALGLATGIAVALAGWAVTGFAGLTHYPHRVGSVASLEQGDSYSPVALALSLGAPLRLAQAFAICAGLALLAALFRTARGPDGDRRAFVIAIAATFVFSPITWLHYFVLLAVPIALAYPTLAPLWFVPLVFWAVPMKSDGHLWRIAVAAALTAIIVGWTSRARAATQL